MNPDIEDVTSLFETLKDREEGTLYLIIEEGKNYFVVGTEKGIWLAHIYCDDSLWLQNPQSGKDEFVNFNFGNTETKIEKNKTCKENDAQTALHSYYEDPSSIPKGNWVSEYRA